MSEEIVMYKTPSGTLLAKIKTQPDVEPFYIGIKASSVNAEKWLKEETFLKVRDNFVNHTTKIYPHQFIDGKYVTKRGFSLDLKTACVIWKSGDTAKDMERRDFYANRWLTVREEYPLNLATCEEYVDMMVDIAREYEGLTTYASKSVEQSPPHLIDNAQWILPEYAEKRIQKAPGEILDEIKRAAGKLIPTFKPFNCKHKFSSGDTQGTAPIWIDVKSPLDPPALVRPGKHNV